MVCMFEGVSTPKGRHAGSRKPKAVDTARTQSVMSDFLLARRAELVVYRGYIKQDV